MSQSSLWVFCFNTISVDDAPLQASLLSVFLSEMWGAVGGVFCSGETH